MRSVALMLALPALFVFSACAGPAKTVVDKEVTPARSTTWEPYTRHHSVGVDGEARGYLVTYDPIPVHAQAEVTRTLPTGSHRILDIQFRDVGFITPNHEVFRYGDRGEAHSLGVAPRLDDGLALFYQGTSVMLRPVTATRSPN